MSNLKKEHPYLYRRVRVKAITNILLGLALILLTPESTITSRSTFLATLFNVEVLGFVFLAMGAILFLGLISPGDFYRRTRFALVISATYSFIWLVALALSAATNNHSATGITIIWAYFTYNQFIVALDPSWRAIRVLKHLKDEHDNGR